MDTTKIKTNVALPTEEQQKIDQKKEKKALIWNYTWKILLLLLTVITMIRVPYVGSYIDGLIDYVFGMSKYLLYPLLIFVQISIIFHLSTEKIIKSKKFVIFTALGILCVACIISGIADTVRYWGSGGTVKFVDVMKEYHSNWLAYFKNPNYSWFANTTPVSGGILAVLISFLFNFLSYIVLAIVALICLCICVFIIFNINYRSTKIGLKIRNWMIKKLGGTFKYDGFNELKEVKNNQNKFKKVSKADVIEEARKSEKISIDLLPNTDVSCYNKNFKISGNIQDKIQEFFKKKEIDAVPSELNVYTTYSELCFEAKGKEQVNKIIENGEEIVKFAKLDNFNLTIRGNIVTFEVPNTYFTKISLKSALQLADVNKDIVSVFALDKNSKPYIQDFKNQPTALILGKKGSGSATLAVLMALSMCYITGPEELELKVLSSSSEATYAAFAKLPHANGKIADGIGECIDEINNLQNLINKRVSMFKALDVTNIDQYNSSLKQPQDKIKHILVLISNFENIIKESFQNTKVINDILTNGPKVGVYTILQSYHAGIEAMDELIYNASSQKYILKLDDEGESEKIFNSQRGCQLHGTGDCLTFAKEVKDMIRLQVCNINQAELAQDIDIIKTFYEAKKEEAEPVKTEFATKQIADENISKTTEVVKPQQPKVEEVKKEPTVEVKTPTIEITKDPTIEVKPQQPTEEQKPKPKSNPNEIKVFTPFRFDPTPTIKDKNNKDNDK